MKIRVYACSTHVKTVQLLIWRYIWGEGKYTKYKTCGKQSPLNKLV